jgi:hypothetical protein
MKIQDMRFCFPEDIAGNQSVLINQASLYIEKIVKNFFLSVTRPVNFEVTWKFLC